jgi:(heptosyl)LPS beta-1,4-glucosyltransferase
MRLGGFVIHANTGVTFSRCVDSLAAVCDDLVAVDTGASDGSGRRARESGFRTLRRPWEGFGAARAAAVDALAGCDWIVFLDSDEWLETPAIEALRRLKRYPPAVPHGVLARRDWADLPGRRFLFRVEHHVRLIRADHARWSRRMIIHEAVPPAPSQRLSIALEHRFAESAAAMRQKVERYALLWALRAQLDGRCRRKWPELQRAFHLFRELALKGALLRGGADAWQLARAVADYHARKYQVQGEIAEGAHAPLLAAAREDRLEELFRLLPAVECAPAAQAAEDRLPFDAPLGALLSVPTEDRAPRAVRRG